MSGGGGATYLPVFVQEDTSPNVSTPRGVSDRDPLYAALLGSKIGTAIGGAERETQMNTLDEAVSETIRRDITMVVNKAWMILAFADPETSLRDWDLWGPLINSLLLGVLLGIRSMASVSTFTLTFTLIWLGAATITSSARLLGYRCNILPTISFIGYCLSPLTGASLIWTISPGLFPLKVFLVLGGLLWSVGCSLRLMEIDPALEDRRILASYPFILYFTLLAWIMLVYS